MLVRPPADHWGRLQSLDSRNIAVRQREEFGFGSKIEFQLKAQCGAVLEINRHTVRKSSSLVKRRRLIAFPAASLYSTML